MNYIAVLFIYLLVYLVVAAIMFIPVLGVWFATRRIPGSRRSFVLVVVATVMLAPSWGPATIVVVPVPFGVLFLTALLTWTWGELARWITMFPLWHAIVFPATASLAFLLVRKLPLSRSKAGETASG